MRTTHWLRLPTLYGAAPAWRYGVAVALCAAMVLVKWTLGPLIGASTPFLLLFTPVLVAAWFGGLGPGLLATLLTACARQFFFVLPGGRTGAEVEWLQTGIFALEGVLVSLLSASRQQAEHTLRESEERFRSAVSSMAEGLAVIDGEGRFLVCNEAGLKILGLTFEQMAGRTALDPAWRTVHEDGSPFPQETHPLVISWREGRVVKDTLMGVERPDGTHVWVLINSAPLLREGQSKPFGAVASFTDVTAHRERELTLQRRQSEVQALNEQLRRAMRETHHRVRNNLQIIAAIADMQVMEGSATIPVEEVQRIGSQVRVLAAVHDLLTYQAREGGEALYVPARDVLQKLVELLQQSAGSRQIRAELDDVLLTARQGTSLAVVANELILNALKNSDSDVTVSFRLNDGHAELKVLDQGAGFPEWFDPILQAHTGLELVGHIARWDLSAEVRFGNAPEGGGVVTLLMPLDTGAVPA